MSHHVFVDSSSFDLPDCLLQAPVLTTQNRRPAFVGTDCSDLLGSKLPLVGLIGTGSPFGFHVGHIGRMVTDKEVVWAHAERSVTSMQDMHPSWDWTMPELVGPTVSSPHGFGTWDGACAPVTSVFGSNPKPAVVGQKDVAKSLGVRQSLHENIVSGRVFTLVVEEVA